MVNPNNFSPPDSKLIWFGLPKTASSSQKKAVALSFGLLDPSEVKGQGKGGGLPLKVVNTRLHNYSLEEVRDAQRGDPEVLSFCTVRNPYDRFVSLWNERVRGRELGHFKRGIPGGLSLEEFAEWLWLRPDDRDVDHHCHRQVTKTVLRGELVPRVLMHFETLAEDWTRCQQVVRERTGRKLKNLDHLRNGRRHSHYRDLYTDRARELVAERYADDLRWFSYEF